MDTQSIFLGIVGLVAFLVATWHLVDFLCPWLKNDLRYLKMLIGIQRSINKASKRKPIYTMLDKFTESATEMPDKPFVYFEDEVWSYKKMDDFTTRVARVMWNNGVKQNKTVALLMVSRPEFIGVWFGVGKTGATTAFINYNIRGKSLLHCLKVSNCKAIVVGNDKELLQAISDIYDDIREDGIQVFVSGKVDGKVDFEYKSLNELIEEQPNTPLPKECRKDLQMDSHFGYVYTSGTTGLPKAALIRHDRSWLISQIICLGGAKKDDIIYSPLPLYHASAGMVGVLGTLYLGCSIAVKKKFSASQFWPDCRKFNATFVQYIGETMRYVCNQPPHPDDKNHRVRIVMGNGLRPRVWKTFLDRFGSDINVVELYAATEGNAGFLNLDNHLGSVGTLSPLMKAAGLVYLIKYDQEKEEVFRDANGRCAEVPYGTPGLLICKITKSTAFHGYRGNKKLTEKKILRNVFKDGDAFFNSGDLLRREKDYHMYFVDRIGDTFRWKGENVSTNEVSDVLCEAPCIKEANVYGVEVPGNEGRAGMVVVLLQDGEKFDSPAVYKHACDCLASYARPLFLRIKTELELTGTFKQKKGCLAQEGFDPKNMGGDPLYFLDHSKKSYTPLSHDLYEAIVGNKIRL